MGGLMAVLNRMKIDGSIIIRRQWDRLKAPAPVQSRRDWVTRCRDRYVAGHHQRPREKTIGCVSRTRPRPCDPHHQLFAKQKQKKKKRREKGRYRSHRRHITLSRCIMNW